MYNTLEIRHIKRESEVARHRYVDRKKDDLVWCSVVPVIHVFEALIDTQ